MTNLILGLLIALAIPLLFTIDLNLHQHRLHPYLWNTGHILLFFALLWLTLNLYKLPPTIGFLFLFIGLNITVFLLGLGIEEIQFMRGRENSIDDIYKNCLGASLAILFHPKMPSISFQLRSTLRLIAILILFIALYPLAKNTIDWVYAGINFPILSNFETPFETERWVGRNLVVSKSKSDSNTLHHRFDGAKYSSVSLIHFPTDWEGFQCFKFRILNPGSNEVFLRIRINDQHHDDTTQSNDDRFNHFLDVLPGWNSFVINLTDIRSAPRNRSMDMSKIKRISFFTSYLKNETAMYFDDLELIYKNTQCAQLKNSRI